ncbi:LysM peptidoglycan-binding domain-containing protein, partial [Atopobacter sp. AH10]|uniref:LysM peptidoglycan-binding domain-containing protein n=1 Tax=Atopobacter sp. AH10 TaxID=2315861 RepID=UPI000EF27EB4
ASKSEASGRTIQVKAGDGFYVLARRAGVSMDALLKANGLTIGSMIHPGQQLKLPGDAPVSQANSNTEVAKPQAGVSTPNGSNQQTASVRPSATNNANQSAGTIQVKAGDGFYVLARRAGVSMDALLKANGLTIGSMIHPGQQLKLPANAPVASTPAPSQAVQPNVQAATKAQGQVNATQVNAQSSTSQAVASQTTSSSVTVQPGQGLWRIAHNNGMTLEELKQLNGLTSNLIFPGQSLRVK